MIIGRSIEINTAANFARPIHDRVAIRCTRLPFGIKTAGDILVKQRKKIVYGLPGISIVWGPFHRTEIVGGPLSDQK